MSDRTERRERVSTALYAAYLSTGSHWPTDVERRGAKSAAATAVDLAEDLLRALDEATQRYDKRAPGDSGVTL